jgi:hypothetical protein
MDHDGPAAWTIGIGVTILVVGGLLIAAMSSCSGFGNFNLGTPRKHLKPIPIDKRACPYVVAMHETANAFQSAEPALFGFYLGPGDKPIDVRWPRVHVRVQKTLLDLQLAILVGRPHFPAAVRRRLTTTLAAIRTGLHEVSRARSTLDLELTTSDTLSNGQTAFGYAGDLVGKQCSVQLGADSEQGLATPQDIAEDACRRAPVSGKFLNAQPTTIGRARAVRTGRTLVQHPLAHAFPTAKSTGIAAFCWKRARYEYVSYATDVRGHAAMIGTLGWSGKACKHTHARPHECIPPFPAPPPGPPRGER